MSCANVRIATTRTPTGRTKTDDKITTEFERSGESKSREKPGVRLPEHGCCPEICRKMNPDWKPRTVSEHVRETEVQTLTTACNTTTSVESPVAPAAR